MNYHINKKGQPAICKAQSGNCPLGGVHFSTLEEAEDYIKMESGFELLPEVEKESKVQLSDEWKEKFLKYTRFEDFTVRHAREVVKEKLFDKTSDIFDKTYQTWKDLHYENSVKNLRPLTTEEMVDTVMFNIRASALNGWFREYNSDYKPEIENEIITNPKLRNAALNIAFKNYKDMTGNVDLDFNEFVESEIEVYRGGNFNFISNDVFVSYSFDKKIAEKFAKAAGEEIIETRLIKIKDTLGSLQTTGEAEIMVRR